MEWGHFFTIVLQIVIVILIALATLFVGSAIVAAIYDKTKGKR